MTRQRKKTIKFIRVLFILSCITIPIAHWLLFYIYTNLSSFTMAFTDKTGVWSIENFLRFFNEFSLPSSEIRLALRNTLITFAIQMVMFPFQVLVSYFIYKKIPLAKIYRILFFLPSIIFSVAVSMIFMRMVGTTGFIAQFVQNVLNMDYTPELLADSRFANTTVLLNMIWLSIPGDLIIWGGTFARIPEDLLEAGRIDGINWWTEFTQITVPMVWPTVSLQMVLRICGIFGASGQVFLLTGGKYGTITLSAWMYLQLLNNSGNTYNSNVYNYLSAVGLVMTVVAVAISLGIRKITDKYFNEVEY